MTFQAIIVAMFAACGLWIGWIWLGLLRDFAEAQKRHWFRQLLQFDLAAMFTLVAAAAIALALRPVCGLVIAVIPSLMLAWFVKLLLNELLSGTKFGPEPRHVRHYRRRNQSPLVVGQDVGSASAEAQPQPLPRCRKRPRLRLRLRLPRFDATNGWIYYNR